MKQTTINSFANPFAKAIIETTLCIDDLIKMANEYGGTLIDEVLNLKIRIGAEVIIYTRNQYLWENFRILRYTFMETRLA